VYADLQGGLNLKHTSPTGRPLNMGYIEKSGIVATDPSTWGDRKSVGRATTKSSQADRRFCDRGEKR